MYLQLFCPSKHLVTELFHTGTYNLSPSLTCSHLKVTVLCLWYHHLSLQKWSESQTAAGILGGGADKGLQDNSIFSFSDDLWAIGEHRKGGWMEGIRASDCSFKQEARQHRYCQSELMTASRYVPHLSFTSYLCCLSPLFWAICCSEKHVTSVAALSCLRNSKMHCNGFLNTAYRMFHEVFVIMMGAQDRGEVRTLASHH